MPPALPGDALLWANKFNNYLAGKLPQ